MKTLKKHDMTKQLKISFKRSLKLVFRQENDTGKVRRKPTANADEIRQKMSRLIAKWETKIPVMTKDALRKLTDHADCLR